MNLHPIFVTIAGQEYLYAQLDNADIQKLCQEHGSVWIEEGNGYRYDCGKVYAADQDGLFTILTFKEGYFQDVDGIGSVPVAGLDRASVAVINEDEWLKRLFAACDGIFEEGAGRYVLTWGQLEIALLPDAGTVKIQREVYGKPYWSKEYNATPAIDSAYGSAISRLLSQPIKAYSFSIINDTVEVEQCCMGDVVGGLDFLNPEDVDFGCRFVDAEKTWGYFFAPDFDSAYRSVSWLHKFEKPSVTSKSC